MVMMMAGRVGVHSYAPPTHGLFLVVCVRAHLSPCCVCVCSTLCVLHRLYTSCTYCRL